MKTFKLLVVPGYLGLCLIMGGASNEGIVANLVLQMTALLMLVAAFWDPLGRPLRAPERSFVWLLCGAATIAALQFVPLPQTLWTATPGRSQLWDAALLTGQRPSPLQLTLNAHETRAALIWALPALAVSVSMLRLKTWRAVHLAWVIVIVASLSVVVGAVQLAGGQGSSAYLYTVTNRDMAVGLFANANHFATLLLVSIPFVFALARHIEMSRIAPTLLVRAAVGILAVVILTGIAVNGSRAAIALAGPVLAASLLFLRPLRRVRRFVPAIAGLALLGAVGIILSSNDIKLGRPEASLETAGRRDVMWATTGKAIADFLPLGSGLGTFERVYVLYDNPALTQDRYINHAHNDYLELLLETGLLGAALITAFLLWWIRRAAHIFTSQGAGPFAWAGSVASCTILIHSLVDYPLRTAAIGTIFIASCVLMAAGGRSAASANNLGPGDSPG